MLLWWIDTQHGWGNFKVLSLSSTLHKQPKREGVKSDKNGSELRPDRRRQDWVGRPVKMRLLKCGFVMFPVSRRQKEEEPIWHHKNREEQYCVALQNCEAVAIGLSENHSALFSGHKIRYDLQQPSISLTHFSEGVSMLAHMGQILKASEIRKNNTEGKLISLNDLWMTSQESECFLRLTETQIYFSLTHETHFKSSWLRESRIMTTSTKAFYTFETEVRTWRVRNMCGP